jgi:hypothetical protein
MKLTTVKVVLFLLAAAGSSCATLRLGGCNRIAPCGELTAYACETDLVCADAAGHRVWSEPYEGAKDACHICSLHHQ